MARKNRAPEPRTASSEEARAFVQTLQEHFQGTKPSARETKRLREYLGRYDAPYLRSIARRVMIDIVKGPGPMPLEGGPLGPQPPSPSRQGPRTAATTGRTAAKAGRRPGTKRATDTRKSTATGSRRKSARS